MDTKKIDTIFQFYRLGRKIKSSVKEHNHDKMLQGATLHFLESNTASVGEIADFLSIKMSAVSEKLVQLEQLGLIKKTLGGDSRKRKISLTPKGKKTITKIKGTMKTCCMNALDILTKKEMSDLQKILEKINNTTSL